MPIFLDDQPVGPDELADAGTQLEQVLQWAAQRVSGDGRIIVEVRVDGQSLVGDALDAKRNTALDGAEVRLISADRTTLVLQTLEQVRERLQEARGTQARAADLLQHDKLVEALGQVSGVVEAWQQTQAAVVHAARIMNIDLESVQAHDGQTLSELALRLIDQLKAMRALLEAGDTVGLADELAYEWPATIERWDAMIARLIEIVQQS